MSSPKQEHRGPHIRINRNSDIYQVLIDKNDFYEKCNCLLPHSNNNFP